MAYLISKPFKLYVIRITNFLEKIFKKPLTNRDICDIINSTNQKGIDKYESNRNYKKT